MNSALYKNTLKTFLAPIQALLNDPSVSEIMINGPSQIYAERKGKLELTSHRFRDGDALMAAAKNIAQSVNRPLDELHPTLDARLPDGSRVHAVLPPLSRAGVSIAIRKFSRDTLTVKTLIESGSLSSESADFLCGAVNLGKNILVSGGTGSGKTSLLNVLTGMLQEGERILVLEDAAELQPQQPHVVSLETRVADRHGRGEVSIRDLFRSALRMRPDRIIIGEMRGAEALDVIQAMTSGHHGSMSTLHANGEYDALTRLETMALMANVGLPLKALREQVTSAIDLIVQVARLKDGSRRVVSISEVKGLTSEGAYEVMTLFRLNITGREGSRILAQLEAADTPPSFLAELHKFGFIPSETSPWSRGRSMRNHQTRPQDDMAVTRPCLQENSTFQR